VDISPLIPPINLFWVGKAIDWGGLRQPTKEQKARPKTAFLREINPVRTPLVYCDAYSDA
jgi:hypothetical protein